MSLTVGEHRFQAELDGHVPLDTTLTVNSPADAPHLVLHRVPPGELRLNGDEYADIFIDERRVGSGQLQRRNESLSPGRHRIEVIFSDGSTSDLEVEVQSGETVYVIWESRKLSLSKAGER
jgi:hypothetical protein